MSKNVETLKGWLRSELNCVPGAREFNRGRYCIYPISSPRSTALAFEQFLLDLREHRTVAGLFVVDDDVEWDSAASAIEQMGLCARMVSYLTSQSIDLLLNGGVLNFSVDLCCPITNRWRTFDDFDAVAFCPSAAKLEDPLYDPMMAAIIPCININSDLYAFSMFTRDLALVNGRVKVSQRAVQNVATLGLG